MHLVLGLSSNEPIVRQDSEAQFKMNTNSVMK